MEPYMQNVSTDKVAIKGSFSKRAALVWLVASLGILVLFARIMTYPLQHDEQFYIPAAILFSFDGLYSDFGFSHLPNLPLLLSGVFAITGSGYYVLVGRLVIFISWLLAIGALVMVGRRHAQSNLVVALLIALMVANPALLDATGVTVTNNFIATPFALLGLLAFIEAARRPMPSYRLAALAGFLLAVAVGFKANYVVLLPPIALAAILAPPHLSMRKRLTHLALPLVAGGLVGAAPTLYFFTRDPTGFVAHVVRFHRGPQIGYWLANADPLDPKAIGLAAKALLAQRSWLSATNLIILMTLAFYLTLGFRQRQSHLWPGAANRWPILLLMGIIALAALMSFLPTPAFPQYFTTPIPFAILLIAFLHGALGPDGRHLARPFLIAALAVTVVTGAPFLLLGAPKIFNVARWTGIQVHRDSTRIARLASVDGRTGMLATLAPVYALEGNLAVYPSLAMGPFVYRASAWIPAGDRQHYRSLTSPATVATLLENSPPAAVLTGQEGALDEPLSAFAVASHYIPHRIRIGSGGAKQEMILFTRPQLQAASLASDCVGPVRAGQPPEKPGKACR